MILFSWKFYINGNKSNFFNEKPMNQARKMMWHLFVVQRALHKHMNDEHALTEAIRSCLHNEKHGKLVIAPTAVFHQVCFFQSLNPITKTIWWISASVRVDVRLNSSLSRIWKLTVERKLFSLKITYFTSRHKPWKTTQRIFNTSKLTINYSGRLHYWNKETKF